MARLFSSLLLIALPALSWAQSTPAMTWGASVSVSNTSGRPSTFPKVAATGDTVHAIWWDNDSWAQPGSAYYKRSLDGGVTWQDQYILSAALSVGATAIVTSGSKVVAFWADQVSGQYIVRSARSTDAGATWSAAQDISPSLSTVVSFVRADTGGGQVVVFWAEVSGSAASLKVRISTDDGQTWGSTLNVPTFNFDPNEGLSADVAIAGSAIVVGYIETPFAVRTVRSTDWGQTWSSPALVYSDASHAMHGLRLAAYGSSAVLRWARIFGAYNSEAMAVSSADGGMSWSTPTSLSSGLAGDNTGGDVCIYGSRTVTIWLNNPAPGATDFPLYYRRSLDGGQTWEPATIIPTALYRFDAPRCTTTPNSVYIVGYAGSGNTDIYLFRGQAWGADLELAGQIVFHSNRDGNLEIYSMNADGTGVTQLTNNLADDVMSSRSPDGTKVAFVSDRDGNNEIYVMNADGTGVTRLTNNAVYDGQASWSPDGSKIAFMSYRDDAMGEIYVMNANGTGGVTRLTNSPTEDYSPAWSPDGTRIAYASRSGGNGDIYLMNPDGSNQTQLTTAPGTDASPSWSPDGSKILFYSDRDGQGEVYVMNADGSNQVRLTNNPAADYPASINDWSPEGTKLLMNTNRDGNLEIYMMNADGSNLIRLTSNSDLDGGGAWTPFQHIGSTTVGTSLSRTLTIKNRGDATLNVSNIASSDGQFTLSPTSFSLAPGSSQNVTVTFNPTSAGVKYSTLTITSNDATSPTAKLMVNGTAIQPPPTLSGVSPTRNDADAARNANITATFTQTMNAGTSSIFVTHGSLTGSLSGVYGGGGSAALSFDPGADFKPGETVEVSLTSGIQSAGGTAISPQVWKFTAAAGTGPAQFTAISRNIGPGNDYTYDMALGDVDADGDLDLAVGNGGGSGPAQSMVYLNDGVGNFAAGTRNFGAASDQTGSVAFGDVDRDGDLDIAVGKYNQQDAVYLNDGSGNFTAGTRNFGTGSDATTSVAFGDVDKDGDLDIAVGKYNNQQNAVYLNDGAGNFTAGTRNFGTDSDNTQLVALGDVDGDGDLDIAVGNYNWPGGQQSAVYLNDGSGNFTAGTRNFGGSHNTICVALGDVDGDGDLDVAAGNDAAQNAVYLNDGSGNFTAGTRNFGTGSDVSQTVALGDVDGDGDLDIAVGNYDAQQDVLYLNDGSGNFTAGTRNFGTGSDQTIPVVLGDVDGDTDLDIVVGINGYQNAVYLNQTATPQISVSASSVAAGTVNVGSSGTATFTVGNTGSAALSVTGITVGGTDASQFTVSPSSFTVNAGAAAQTVTATFAPTSAGSKSASLSITHNAIGSPSTVSLSGTGAQPPAPAFFTSLTSWTKYSGNPVLNVSAGQFDAAYLYSPMVLYDGIYRMWYVGYPGSGVNHRIGYATSADGITWAKYGVVLDVGSGWEQQSIHAPSVIKDGGLYKMWYSGHSGAGGQMDIGYATSPDGQTWTKYAGNPVFLGSSFGSSTELYVGTVLKEGTTYKMWYGATPPATAFHLRYATSADGITWTDSGQILGAGSSGAWDESLGAYCNVLKKGELYEMWYEGTRAGVNAIGYATSADGITWTKSPYNPVLSKGSAGSWEGSHVADPAVLLEGEAHKMWYKGYDGSLNRIGYATSGSATASAVLSFGNANLGSSGTQTFTVSNAGNAALTISNITLSGTDASQFSVSPTTFTINPGGAAQTVTVTFAPTSAGVKSGALTIVHNAAGSPSTVSLSGTGTDSPPATPAGLLATPGNGQVSLSWTANTESDLSHYVVYRSTADNFTPTAADSIARVNKPTATYTNTGLSAGTYYFKLAAVDSAGNKSAASAQVSASPSVVDTDPPWWQVSLPSNAVVLYRQTFEGLSLGASPEGWSTSSSITATSSPAYNGSRAAQVTGNLPYKSYRLTSTYTSGTILMEGAIKAAAGGNCGFMADVGVYPQGDDGFNAVWWGSDGAWHSYNAAGGLNTFSTTVGDWHRIKVTIHLGTTPTYDLDFDGSRIVSGAMYGGGVAGTSSFRGISLQGGYSNSNYVDDLRVVYTPGDTTKPAVPAGLAATPGNGQATLTWTANTESDLSHYVVYRSTADNFTPATTDSIARVNKPTATYTNTGLPAGTYYFKLAAVDSAGNKSAASAQASATITILVKAGDPNPASLRFTGSGSLAVSVSDSGNTSLSVTPSLTGTDAAQFSVTPNAATTVAPGATQGFTVTFTPSPAAGSNRAATLSLAHNATNKGTPVTVSLVGDAPPGAPAGLTATPGNAQATLTWTANTENDLSHYVVYRSTTNNFTPTAADSITRVNKPTVTYTNTGLAAGTYYYKLAAVDSAGNKSAASAQTSALIEPHIAVSPTALSFGNVRTGTTRTQTFTVANTGTDTLKVSALSLSGTDAGRFAFSPAAFAVAPGGAAQVVSVSFSPAVGSQSVTPKSAALSFADNAPESPQVSMSGIATAPAIALSPSPLDFGSVTIGQSATSLLTVSNTGTDTLLVTSLALSGSNADQFPLAAGQGNPLYTIAPNASQAISVPFVPTSTGAKSATLTLIHNAAPTATSTAVNLSGTGSNIPVPTLSPNPLAFGNVKVGQNKSLILTVTNNGSVALSVATVTSSDPAFAVSVAPLTVPANGGSQLAITFVPQDRTARTAILTLTYATSSGAASVTATLTGQGTQPVIAVPDSLRFGDVNIETEQRRILPLTIRNTGNDTLVLSEVTQPTGVFSATLTVPPVLSLKGGDSTRVNITFAPASMRVDTASVTIRSNAANAPTVRLGLSGRGTLVGFVVRPDTLDFGRVRVDSAATRTLTVANSGSLPLAIDSTASSSPRFSAQPRTFTVNGGDSARVAVNFAPVQKGVEIGTLILSGNAQHKRVVTRGIGVRPELAVFPDSLDFLEVVMPDTGVLPLQVSNAGNDTLRVTRINRDNLRFTLSDSVFALPPDSAKSVAVHFAPTQPGRVELGRLVLATNAGNREVRVRGRGIEYDWTVSPSPLEFGRVRVDSSRSRTISIVNRGQARVKIDSFVVVGGGGAVELVRLDLPPSIAGGTTVEVATLRFAPRTAGQLPGVTLRVKSGELVRSVSVMGEGITPPDMAVTPDSLVLGPVALGGAKTGTLEIRNTGGDTLHLSQLRSDQEVFSAAPAALTLAPGALGTIRINFRPAAEGEVRARLLYSSDDPNPPQIRLSGRGIPLPAILSYAPADTLRFGVVSPAQSELQPLVIRNRGRGPLWVVLRSESGEFAPEQGDTLRIAAQDSMQALIRFTPARPGYRFGNLLIASNDRQVPLARLMMRGEGGGLRLEPPAIDFDEVVVGSRVDTAIQVINQSAGQWTLFLSVSDAGFGINPTALRLEPKTSGRVQVWFQPASKGEYRDTIEVQDRPLLNVILSGTGAEDPDIEVSSSRDFDEVAVGQVGVGTLTVWNKGRGPLKIFDLSSSRLEYQIAQADSLPLVIPPGGDHPLQVSFTPDTTGEVSGSLTIRSNDPDEQEVVRHLNGQGRLGLRSPPPCIAVTTGEQEEEFYFGRLEAGEERELPLVVRNDCQGVLRVERIEADSRQVAADPESLVVAAGESRWVGMRLRAELGEAQEGVVRLVSNDPDHPVVRRRWYYTPERPCAEVLTEQLRFGPVEGGQRTALLAISNPCSARLVVDLMDEERQLTFAEERLVVEPEQLERVRVSYAGSGGSGQVVLATNDPARRQLTIPWEAQAPLQVRSASPREGATGVGRQTIAQLEFDQALRQVVRGLASVQLQILPEPLNNWRRQVQVEDYILSIPLELAAGANYRLVVVEAEAQSGARLIAPFELHFSTAAQALVVGSIAGRVLFDDGSSVVGTVFLANMQKELVGSARIARDGSYTLNKVPEGRYQLFAQEKATGLSIAYEQEVEVRAGQTINGIELFLLARQSIEEKVVVLNGEVIIEEAPELLADSTFAVPIHTKGVQDLSGFAIQVSFDPENVTLVEVRPDSPTEKNVLYGAGGFPMFLSLVKDAGNMEFGGSLLGPAAPQAPDEGGLLAYFTFRALRDPAAAEVEVVQVRRRTLQGEDVVSGGTVRPTRCLAADFDCSGAVDFDDFFHFADHFGKPAQGETAHCDLDKSGTVDFSDFFIFADAFGKTGGSVAKLLALARELLGLPGVADLSPAYPNPFNAQTTIGYQLPEKARVQLVIYDLLGQQVRTLMDQTQEGGNYRVVWDGRDIAGNAVASGVYFYRLEAGPFHAVRKLLLLR